MMLKQGGWKPRSSSQSSGTIDDSSLKNPPSPTSPMTPTTPKSTESRFTSALASGGTKPTDTGPNTSSTFQSAIAGRRRSSASAGPDSKQFQSLDKLKNKPEDPRKAIFQEQGQPVNKLWRMMTGRT